MEEDAVEINGKRAVLDAFAALYPWTGDFHSRPLRAYAKRLFEPPRRSAWPHVRERSFAALLVAITRAGRRAGLSDESIGKLCGEFEVRPVMQTGPHLLLLIEPEAFYSHAFSLSGLSAHGCSTYLSYAVSTVDLVEKGRRGPAWLNAGGCPINVFGISRSRMIPYSLLSNTGAFRLELTAADEDVDSDTLATLRALLPSASFERPAHALKAANRVLWPNVFGTQFTALQIDDEDIADLVMDHLSEEASWLRTRLLEDAKFSSAILTGIDQLAAGPWSGWLSRSTDFFWFYEEGKRLPLRLVAGDLVQPGTGKKVARFATPDLLERLANRSLIPNLLLMFLVLSILPGVRVLGGSHHPIYYPLMRYVVYQALERLELDAELRNALKTDDAPAAWGHRVIECQGDSFGLLRTGLAGGMGDLIDRLGDMPLQNACGNMSSFTGDPSWQGLSGRLRDGAISPSDVEWAFS